MENNNTQQEIQEEQTINIKDIIFLCLSKWYWFVVSVIIALALGVFYILSTPPVYTRTAQVLIKETKNGKSVASEMMGFEDMGLFRSRTNVQDELIAFKSPAVMYEVVKRLGLNVNYTTEGRFHTEVLYGTHQPVEVSFLEIPENEGVGFAMNISKDGQLKLTEFVRHGEKIEAKPVLGTFNDTIVTPLGKLAIIPTPYFIQGKDQKIQVSRSGLQAATKAYVSRLNAGLAEKDADVISLSCNDVCLQRAEDLLNTVIAVYNENWVKDKNLVAVSTSRFINERLAVIEQDLGTVDSDISTFKSENLLPDIQAASNLYMTQSSATSEKITTINNQLYMSRYVRNYVIDEQNKFELLPSNTGIEGGNINQQISEYNKQLLQRMTLVANSSEKNPLVKDLDTALESMREALITSIDNQIETLKAQLKSLEKTERQATSKLAANPNQAKYLLSVERQQKVKEALYLFLLQKREENELSQAFTAYNTRIITPPYGGNAPIAPRKQMILLVAFLLGLIVPAGIIFVQEMMNTSVRGRKDLDVLTIPFLGEIPYYGKKRRRNLRRVKGFEHEKKILVKSGKRDVVNEAFRVLRTNLEFMTESGGKDNVILFTSFNPGSGKSFMSANVAISLGIKGKKVVVIDGDMRHASMSVYVNSPEIGLSDYLNHQVDNWKQILTPSLSCPENVDVIGVGTIPPNPSELLYSDRLKSLIETLREKYDYVLIDCPPIELVADTQIIEQYADRTVFVVRAGLLEKAMLPEIQKIYNEKKYKNMAIVLNGTYSDNHRCGYKYGYKYGYRYSYSYHYGYGYGYHYGNVDQKKDKEA